jgi:hypothetical protein
VLFTALPGSIFGENAILGLSTDGKRNRKSVATKNTELCCLSTAAIRHLILDFPSFDMVWRHHLTHHLAKLDAIAFVTGAHPPASRTSATSGSVGAVPASITSWFCDGCQ